MLYPNKLIFLLAVWRFTIASPLLQQPLSAITRLVGGVEVTPHTLPYQVAIFINDVYFCGGVLISPKYVLTAAHCVYNSSDKLQIILGAHDLYDSESTKKVFENSVVIVHENYTGSYYDDIALVKLEEYVELTDAIAPISDLADSTAGDFLGSTAVLSGWGYTHDYSYAIEYKLRKVGLEIMDNSNCNAAFALINVSIEDTQLCTSGYDSLAGLVGACHGDSGGPLTVGSTLVGLVSFGYGYCEGGFPTVFTRISSYRDWIAKYSGV